MTINLIYCRSTNYVIGYLGQIPWHSSDDLKVFKSTTSNEKADNFLIMGRKTYESMCDVDLGNRKAVVISKTMATE
jgi:dihydrofolate reductase